MVYLKGNTYIGIGKRYTYIGQGKRNTYKVKPILVYWVKGIPIR